MRDLKFRVWSEDQKTYDYKFPYNSIGDFYVSTRGVIYSDFGNTITPEVRQEAFIIEQYTGLKDKNGKEIYEGDIVKINGWWDAAGPAGYDKNLCTIKWDEEITGFVPFNDYDCDCGVYHHAEDCEVIGNIHENPELVKEKE